MSKEPILQDVFLNTLCKNHETVNVYLINGIRLQGKIEAFDRFVVMVKDSVTRMVYKHAISTIAPPPRAPGRSQKENREKESGGASPRSAPPNRPE